MMSIAPRKRCSLISIGKWNHWNCSRFMTLWPLEYASFIYATILDEYLGLIQQIRESTYQWNYNVTWNLGCKVEESKPNSITGCLFARTASWRVTVQELHWVAAHFWQKIRTYPNSSIIGGKRWDTFLMITRKGKSAIPARSQNI